MVVLVSAAAITWAATSAPRDDAEASSAPRYVPAETVTSLPVPDITQSPAAEDPCALPEFTAALAAGDDPAAIAAVGGGEAFRAAVAAGSLSCVGLSDPGHVWVVVNKHRPLDPIDVWPPDLVVPDRVSNLVAAGLRPAAAASLTAMADAVRAAGAGDIGIASAFRSYGSQQATYGRHAAERGVAGADAVSARPGYSEHQSGLGVDVVPCGNGCGTLDDVAGSPQGAWLVEHAWEFGWIVRYEEDRTDVTGYLPEPWHLRYIGPELARAYHDGGWHTLEEFFGLDAAPDYRD